jgi:hypothetical protein
MRVESGENDLTIPHTPMSEYQARADKYRREAAEIRQAAEIVWDDRFREQLLTIADQYDSYAASIEAELASQNETQAIGKIGSAGEPICDPCEDANQRDGENQGDDPTQLIRGEIK